MNGLGAAALLLAWLRPPQPERWLDRRDAVLLRLGLALAVQLGLFLALTLAVR